MEDAFVPAIKPGVSAFRQNVNTLMMPPRSPSRKKAILTIARKNNISREDAQFKQAIRIAQSQSRKPD